MLQSRYKNDTSIEVGIDEAGRGCLWGPLVAGAVIWLPEDEWTEECREVSAQIKDSKKLTPKKRASLRNAIEGLAIDFSVGIVSAAEIDRHGMTASNCLAFERALQTLAVEPDRILLDGCLRIETEKEQIVEVEADNKYIAVAAASILAKESHDEIVKKYCEEQPALEDRYHLLSCKGYGTAAHRDGIEKHGPHLEHRRLFLRKILYDFID